MYEKGPARPSGGCGAVALLIGPDASLVLEPQRTTHALDCWDFYKPKGGEYPLVDGALSQACYLRCVDACYSNPGSYGNLAACDYCVFHAPYNKLVRKAHARLALRDSNDRPRNWCVPGDVAYEQSLVDKGLDASLRKASADDYDKRVAPSTEAPTHRQLLRRFLGRVCSALQIWRKRICFLGSGAVASMYVLKGRSGKIALSAIGPRSIFGEAVEARRAVAWTSAACDARGLPGAAPLEPVEVCRSRRARSSCGVLMGGTGASTGGWLSLVKFSHYCT